jgi:purine-binding chemotaxis protein CheW
VTDYVSFTLDGRSYATRITEVREVVRLAELVSLPGMEPPLAGVFDLRGVSLPVLDIRREPGGPGDVLVLQGSESDFGFACDHVTAVVDTETLVPEESDVAQRGVLPPYVETVLRGPDGAVFLVDLRKMAGADPSQLIQAAKSLS